MASSAKRTGEWQNAHCTTYAAGKGNYEFLPGPGAKPKFTGSLGAVVLEGAAKAKITCSSGTSSGEYTGASTLTITLTLSGCERASDHEQCQSVAAPAGQITTSALEGELGIISRSKPLAAGLDLEHSPTLATFECSSTAPLGKEVVSLEGSVIGAVKKLDAPVAGFTVTFKQHAGSQLPEAFEGGAADTLSTAILGGGSEPTGLAATLSLSDEEPLEIKAETLVK